MCTMPVLSSAMLSTFVVLPFYTSCSTVFMHTTELYATMTDRWRKIRVVKDLQAKRNRRKTRERGREMDRVTRRTSY